ncbi:MAG: hypothetical protein Q8928_17510 [Bacteroidota bacterium]|nr:hypothetical protein [Bacteroidota bacterium]
MEKLHKIGVQIYGYAICLVSVVTFLISASVLTNALIDRSDPIHAGWNNGPSLASFENYKQDILKSAPKNADNTKVSYIPDDKTLHAMYEAARNDKIQSSKFQATKNMATGAILIIISLALFITHWRWMQNIIKSA